MDVLVNWRDAVEAAVRWRDDPKLAAQLRAAFARVRLAPGPSPRDAFAILEQEEERARRGWELADEAARPAAFAAWKRWQASSFGYSETQRSAAGRLAAEEAARAAQDKLERARAQAVIDRFRTSQQDVRLAMAAILAADDRAPPFSELRRTAFPE